MRYSRIMWNDVHRDVNELHKVANESHDSETDSDCLADLGELCGNIRREPARERRHGPFWSGFVQRVRNWSSSGEYKDSRL